MLARFSMPDPRMTKLGTVVVIAHANMPVVLKILYSTYSKATFKLHLVHAVYWVCWASCKTADTVKALVVTDRSQMHGTHHSCTQGHMLYAMHKWPY